MSRALQFQGRLLKRLVAGGFWWTSEPKTLFGWYVQHVRAFKRPVAVGHARKSMLGWTKPVELLVDFKSNHRSYPARSRYPVDEHRSGRNSQTRCCPQNDDAEHLRFQWSANHRDVHHGALRGAAAQSLDEEQLLARGEAAVLPQSVLTSIALHHEEPTPRILHV